MIKCQIVTGKSAKNVSTTLEKRFLPISSVFYCKGAVCVCQERREETIKKRLTDAE